MPAKNFLTFEQVVRLQEALRESEEAHVRERILILLLQNDGKTQQDIANFIGCSPRTVAYWCMHGAPDNLDSLHNKREQVAALRGCFLKSSRKAQRVIEKQLLNM